MIDDREQAPVSEADVGKLADRCAGEVITPDHERYDVVRATFNGAVDKRPAVIVRCASVADVQLAVRFARDHGLGVAVRGGGHSVAGHSMSHGGLTIDLREMHAIVVDPAAGVATAEGGALLGELDTATVSRGTVVPAGVVSHTGLGGLALGGGYGYLSRLYGLTCDSLTAAEVVSADGDVLTTDDDTELLWALRGGGGNFGVVTRLHLRLHSLPPVVTGVVAFPEATSIDVLSGLGELMAGAPRELSCIAQPGVSGAAPFLPGCDTAQQYLVVHVALFGHAAVADGTLSDLRALGPVALDSCAPSDYLTLQSRFDPFAPHGMRYRVESGFLPRLNRAVAEALVECTQRRPSPTCGLGAFSLGGAVGDVAQDATAFAARDAQYNVEIQAVWTESRERDQAESWARQTRAELAPHMLPGSYVNMLTDSTPGVLEESYGASTYARLRGVKARLDPANRFRSNHNIEPATPLDQKGGGDGR